MSEAHLKTSALVLTLGLAALFAAPGVRHLLPERFAASDSFPVSTFAMFSKARPPEHRMTWVRGLDAHGKSLGPVPSGAFNSSGMNQTMAFVREARTRDRERRAQICGEIAAEIVRRRSVRQVARIEIVDAYYLAEKVFGPERDDRPERERVLVACAVER